MTSSATDAPIAKSESAPASDEALRAKAPPSQPVDNPPAGGQKGEAEPCSGAPPTKSQSVAGSDEAVTGKTPPSQPANEPAAGGLEGEAEPCSDASVSKEEMERYIKIARDLKLRRGSLMPPGRTAGKAVTTVLSTGVRKKANLSMEAHVELFGKGHVKLSFDGVSEDAHAAQAPACPDESATSLVRRGGPSTAITPRRLSLEERAPPPTPAPSLASLHQRTKSMDFGTIPLKDDDHPEPSHSA